MSLPRPKKNETSPGAYGILAGLLTLAFVAWSVVLGGCSHGLQVRHRNPDQRATMAVHIRTFCLLADPFDIGAVAYEGGYGSGVMIDNTHVLTANHVVDCPTRPMITVSTWDGREYSMFIEKQWGHNDVARLVIAKKGERFYSDRRGGDIAPPYLALPPMMGEPVCSFTAHPKKGVNCGPLVKDTDEANGDLYIEGMAWRGNSGSGVYDAEGRLVGILVSGYFRQDGTPAGMFMATSIQPQYIR